MGLYSMPNVADAFLPLVFFAHVLMPFLLLKDWIVFHVGHGLGDSQGQIPDQGAHDPTQDLRPRRTLGVHVTQFRRLCCDIVDDGESRRRCRCCVCLRGFDKDDEISQVLACRHFFHRSCLDRWLLDHNHSTCPLCRTTTAAV